MRSKSNQSFASMQIQLNGQNQTKSKSKSMSMYVVLLIFMIAAGVLAAVFATKKNSDDNSNDTNNDSSINNVFSYWVFNVTNPVKCADGSELPKLDMIGPYVFKRYAHKSNVELTDNATKTTYLESYEYEFQASLSTDIPIDSKIYCISR